MPGTISGGDDKIPAVDEQVIDIGLCKEEAEKLVSVGDRVARGDKVGTTGRTGFTGSNGVHIAMSVGSQFVSPYDTWQDSEIAGKVIIAKVDE